MRIPITWDDRSPLDDELLKNVYAIRCISPPRRSRAFNWASHGHGILQDLRRADCLQAVEAWLGIAFSASNGRLHRQEVVADDNSLQLFLEFYWQLYQTPHSTKDAREYLDKERLKRGCEKFIPTDATGLPTQAVRDTSAGSPNSVDATLQPRSVAEDTYDAELSKEGLPQKQKVIPPHPITQPSIDQKSATTRKRKQAKKSSAIQKQECSTTEVIHSQQIVTAQNEGKTTSLDPINPHAKFDSSLTLLSCSVHLGSEAGATSSESYLSFTMLERELSSLTELSASESETSVPKRMDRDDYVTGSDTDDDVEVASAKRGTQQGRKRQKSDKVKGRLQAGVPVSSSSTQVQGKARTGGNPNKAGSEDGETLLVESRKLQSSKRNDDIPCTTKSKCGKDFWFDSPTRPSKRSRGNQNIADDTSAVVMPIHMQHLTKSNIPQPTSDVCESSASKIAVSSARRGRKRTRSESASATTPELHNKDAGPSGHLRQCIRTKPRKDPMPAICTAQEQMLSCNLGQSAADVDAALRDAAAEGLSLASNDAGNAGDWANENFPEGTDSSDDEDAVPLKDAIAQQYEKTLMRLNSSNRAAVDNVAEDAAPLRGAVGNMLALNQQEPAVASVVAEPVARPEKSVPPYSASPRVTGDARPSLRASPPIWAVSRQEVCESFDWFRSYQSGVYHSSEIVKGYLLSGFPSKRDLFAHGGRIIISHGGGKAESVISDKGRSRTVEADDQLAEDKSVRALLTTHRLGRPIVLLADDKYDPFPYNLSASGVVYVVLGYYRIAYAWAEKEPARNTRGYVVRYKFAFHWCEEQGDPWWWPSRSSEELHAPPQASTLSDVDGTTHSDIQINPTTSNASPVEESPTANLDLQPTDIDYTCPICGNSSPRVFAQDWMCLRPRCPSFWTMDSTTALDTSLQYADEFVRLRSYEPMHLEDLRPLPPVKSAINGNTTTPIFCKGWHCRECGRLSCRSMWEHWQCHNCKRIHCVPGRVREPREFWRQRRPEKFYQHWIAPDSGIISSPMRFYKTGSYQSYYHTYILPEGRGHIYLINSTQCINSEADQIFHEYQRQAANAELLFRRWPLRAHKCRGTLLTNYFSQNTGEPYQYVGGTDNTVSWENAPSAVCRALELIRQRMREALNLQYRFNEVLSAAYMEEQSMAFHSDSEKGLGDTVASLSLGSAAYMHFRLHKQYSNDRQGKNALTLYLRHGDIVVMHGAQIQECYEHTVIPLNFRIAATARLIDPTENNSDPSAILKPRMALTRVV